jgi:hypothetical protein
MHSVHAHVDLYSGLTSYIYIYDKYIDIKLFVMRTT